MPLTETQLAAYAREGYLVLPGLVPTDAIDAVLAARRQEDGGGGWGAEALEFDRLDARAEIHRLLVEPAVLDVVETLFGGPARVYYGMLAVVPAHGGNGLPWHQDNQYSQVLPQALNTFIAMCDITPDKAILWVAPGTHRLGTQPSKDSDLYGAGHREAAVEPANGIPLPTLRKGDACVFDRNTYHRSLRNETGEDRYAYAAQYCTANARLAADGSAIGNPLARDLRERWLGGGVLREVEALAHLG